ncbi:MAG: restriction endonuclease subunit S [Candidatus Limnocylindrales bacterium]|jgi:hypothetical protein
MASEWREATLDQVVDFTSGGTPSKDDPKLWGGSIPWCSAKDMKVLRIGDTEDHVSEAGLKSTRLATTGTILLLTRGMTLLKDIPICVTEKSMAFNQDVKALHARPGLDSDYLLYWLLANKARLLGMVDLAGHGTGRLNTDELKSLDIVLPPLAEQRRIVRVLRALDDKIELNRRMSQTLESMARGLFDASFGDEWSVAPLGSMVVSVREQVRPFAFPERLFDHYSIPAFDESGMPLMEPGSEIKSAKWRVHGDEVLLSKLNPETGRVWLPTRAHGHDAVCSTEFLVLRPVAPVSRPFLYCLLTSRRFRDRLESVVSGTTGSRQRASAAAVLGLPVVAPAHAAIEEFDKVTGPALCRVSRARHEAATLSRLRDSLLPVMPLGAPASGVLP